MKLSLKNIGKINDTTVEINGITVIAGANNTGKSTIGHALFSVFNSFYNLENQMNTERIQSVESAIDFLYRISKPRYALFANTHSIAKKIIEEVKHLKNDRDLIKNELVNFLQHEDEEFLTHINEDGLNEVISRIHTVLDISDTELVKSILNKNLEVEFNGQICNIFTENPAEITLEIKGQPIIVTVENDIVKNIENSADLSLYTEAIYIDDPFVLDDMTNYFSSTRYRNNALGHRKHIMQRLDNVPENINVVDEIITKDKLNNVYDKISSVCSGEVVHTHRTELGYRRKNSDKILNIRNLSAGLKTFVILKMLLMNGSIESNGTIILDEPEIHLHPEWQLLFAELIVLIQKEFGVHILLNTHSPYFLNAIEVYAEKYEIRDKCKYYLSAMGSDSTATIKDVTDQIELIYSKLARPLQELENERGTL